MTSLSMLVVAYVGLALPLGPLIALNFLLFMAVTWLVGPQVSLIRRGDHISRVQHNVWRVVMLAFSVCGLTALASGAAIW